MEKKVYEGFIRQYYNDFGGKEYELFEERTILDEKIIRRLCEDLIGKRVRITIEENQ